MVAGIVTEVDPDLVIEEDVVEEIDVPVHLGKFKSKKSVAWLFSW